MFAARRRRHLWHMLRCIWPFAFGFLSQISKCFARLIGFSRTALHALQVIFSVIFLVVFACARAAKHSGASAASRRHARLGPSRDAAAAGRRGGSGDGDGGRIGCGNQTEACTSRR